MSRLTGPIPVLYVVDDTAVAERVAAELERADDRLTVQTTDRIDDAASALDGGDVECVLTEYALPDGTGIDLLTTVRETAPDLPFVLFTSTGSEEIASAAISAGVTDYVRTDAIADDFGSLATRITDAVARYRTLSDLRKTREEHQELIDGMNDTAWVIDTDERFLAVNDAAVEVMGYSRAELLAMTPHDIDAGLEGGEISELIATMPDDEIQVFETIHETSGGEQFPVEISSSLITFRGETAILSVARDISERKRREDRLERFASIVSHDLRNPLNVAQGRLELAAEACDSEHLAEVNAAHDRMAELIEDLLALARGGDRSRTHEPVAIADLVRRCWRYTDTPNASLSVEIDRTVRGDESRLRQVFENLFRNAVEHGSGTIAVGELEDGFYVEDDGPGVAPDLREAVFEVGFSTTENGTGFGLSIVEEVVEAHGWTVHLTDSAAGGARFEITGVEWVDA